MAWRFWKNRDKGIGVVKCLKCKMFIDTANYGEKPKITKIYWDLCERCQDKERGFIGATNPRDLAIG